MKKAAVILIIFICVSSAMAEKFAGEFLYLGVGGRPLAMGGAYIAAEGDIFSSYYNPAGLTDVENYQAAFMHSETFGSLLNHEYVSLARNQYGGVAALSISRLGGGGILVTEPNNGVFRVVEEESHADYVVGFSYGRKQNSKLDWGLSAKAIYRKIVASSAWGIGLDAGLRYRVRDDIIAAVVFQDLTGTVLSYSNGTKENINPTMKLGLGFSREYGKFRGTILADTDVRFEGRETTAQFSQSWISADTHFGFEAMYADVIAARVGSDIGNLTTGVGLKFGRFVVDLALFDHSDLDTSYRGSLIINW
ncbi:MAG: hypothetical protein GY839_13405 [candidate division Zixibacteria bacterium]|nr:hypothetical protein [candidate division Zixibacteria bacterium]